MSPLYQLIYNDRWHSLVPILLFNNKTEMHLNYPFTGVYIRGSSYCSVTTRTPKPVLCARSWCSVSCLNLRPGLPCRGSVELHFDFNSQIVPDGLRIIVEIA